MQAVAVSGQQRRHVRTERAQMLCTLVLGRDGCGLGPSKVSVCAGDKQPTQLVLTEGAILGGGAFSRVSVVTGACWCSPRMPLSCCLRS